MSDEARRPSETPARRSARAAYLKPGTETAAFESRKAIVRAMVRVAPQILQALDAPEVVAAWEKAEPHLVPASAPEAQGKRPRLYRGPVWQDVRDASHPNVAALRGFLEEWAKHPHMSRAEWLMDVGVTFLSKRSWLLFWAPAGSEEPSQQEVEGWPHAPILKTPRKEIFQGEWEMCPGVPWPDILLRAPLEESRLTAEGLYRHRQELARVSGLAEDTPIPRQEEGMEPPWPSTNRPGVPEWNPLVQAESDPEIPRRLLRATGQEAKRRGYELTRDLPKLDLHAEWMVLNQLCGLQAGESSAPGQDSLAAHYAADAVTIREAVKDLCKRAGYTYCAVGRPGRRKGR